MKAITIAGKGISVCVLLFLAMSYIACASTPNKSAKPFFDPGQATRLFDEGVRFNMDGDFERAISSFTEAIRAYPSFQRAYVARGLAHFVLGRHSEAMRDFNEAIHFGLRPHDLSSYTLALTTNGMIYNIFGEYESALESFNRVLYIAPLSPEALNGRSAAFFRIGRLPAALADVHFAISLDPSRYVYFCNRGTIHYYLGLPYRALADFIASLELNPYNTDTAVAAAAVAKDLGHYEFSLSLYDHALSVKPGFLPAYRGRGNVFIILAGLADDINRRDVLLEKAMADFERASH